MKLHAIYSENSIEDMSKDKYQLELTFDEWTELRKILESSSYKNKMAEDFWKRLKEALIKRTSEWI